MMKATVRVCLLAGMISAWPDVRSFAEGPFTFTIDPATHTFTYTDAQRSFTGIFLKPEGNGPFPAVLINHGQGGTPAGYSLPKALEMVPWGLVAIGPALTHAAGPDIDTSP